ncbi:MAG: asparaginase, partial [Gemmatimonas sp.]
VHTFGIVDRGLGFAIKVEDGAPRAQYPAVLALLAAYDALPSSLPEAVREYAQRAVRNTRGDSVGIVCVADGDVGDLVETHP